MTGAAAAFFFFAGFFLAGAFFFAFLAGFLAAAFFAGFLPAFFLAGAFFFAFLDFFAFFFDAINVSIGLAASPGAAASPRWRVINLRKKTLRAFPRLRERA